MGKNGGGEVMKDDGEVYRNYGVGLCGDEDRVGDDREVLWKGIDREEGIMKLIKSNGFL